MLDAALSGKDSLRRKAAESIIQKGSEDLKKIYREGDLAAGRKPVAQDIIERAESLEGQAHARLSEIQSWPEGSPDRLAATREVSDIIAESRRLRREAAEKISTSRAHGIRVSDVTPQWDAKITELRKSALQSDRNTADALEKLRDGFRERFSDPNEIVPTEALRAVQSDYQRVGFQKPDTKDVAQTASVLAHQEASKIVGGPIVRHITGMNYADAAAMARTDPNSVAGRLFAANERVSVGNNILAGIEARSKLPPAKKSRLDKVVDALHVATAIGTHGASLPVSLAIKAAPHVPGAIDRALVAAGKVAGHVPNVSTISPVGAVVRGTRRLVDRMAEIQAKRPRNPELGAIVINDYLQKNPDAVKYLESRKKLDDAKRLANFAMDKSVDPEKRNAALKEAMSLIEDFGNE